MQIGRQLNRFPPKLDGDAYPEGLRALVSFVLDSDPRTRPSMQLILEHPFIAESRETHPTASLGELVKTYYQWLQKGGQRASLFNPGGAAHAEMPEDNSALTGDEWNFSTTANFEKRYSLVNFDELSASLAEMEAELTPNASPPSRSFEEPRDLGVDMSFEEQANFDERVKRGAAAMEGLFDGEKPMYRYETKNDFVPIEQQSSSDLPLRTDTDRSSVTSTFIDINLGAYDSSHYAAGVGAPAPFQLADADTIRANRSSNRLTRHLSVVTSESQEPDEYPVPRGPRPPTMEWTFPSSMQPSGGDADASEEGEDDSFVGDRDEKRDTREWKFPIMREEDNENPPVEYSDSFSEVGEPAPANGDDEGELTARSAAVPPTGQEPDPQDQEFPFGGPLESRPGTATSFHSTDTDPFRLDRTVIPSREPRSSSFEQFPSIPDSAGDNEFETSSSLGEPANSYQEHGWQDGMHSRNGSFVAPSTPGMMSDMPSHHQQHQTEVLRRYPLSEFPEPVPPSIESLTAGASDDVVNAELDRLMSDILNGLAVTGEALSMVDMESTLHVEDSEEEEIDQDHAADSSGGGEPV